MPLVKEDQHSEARIAETRPPRSWRVVILNDDFTTVDFVVDVLMELYGKSQEDAEFLALEVHFTGRGEAGIYSHEVAEYKAAQTVARARAAGHPLRAVTEVVD